MKLSQNPRWLVGVDLVDMDAVCAAAKDAFLAGSKSKRRLVDEWVYAVMFKADLGLNHSHGSGLERALRDSLEPLRRGRRVKHTPLVDLMGGTL